MVETTEKYNTPPGTLAEIAVFGAAQDAAQKAAYKVTVLNSEFENHLTSLRSGDGRCRTSVAQASISLEAIETVIDDLLKARAALLVVLMKSGDAEAQANDAKAKRVTEILDQMGAGGEFEGLSEDEKLVERQMLGMRLRADMESGCT